MGKRKKLLLKTSVGFIAEHQGKINNELRRPIPDGGLIKHWQSEIRGARVSVARYRLMARIDTLMMGIGLTTRHLRAEYERMDEMFEHEW